MRPILSYALGIMSGASAAIALFIYATPPEQLHGTIDREAVASPSTVENSSAELARVYRELAALTEEVRSLKATTKSEPSASASAIASPHDHLEEMRGYLRAKVRVRITSVQGYIDNYAPDNAFYKASPIDTLFVEWRELKQQLDEIQDARTLSDLIEAAANPPLSYSPDDRQ
jgi:hypothetical protein